MDEWFFHYLQAKSDYEAFYRDSLRYLGCVNMATMPGMYVQTDMYICMYVYICVGQQLN